MPQPMHPALWGTMVGIGVVSCFIVCGFLFLWVLHSRYPNGNKRLRAQRLHIFEHGFVYENGAGETTAFRWDDISAVYQRSSHQRDGFDALSTVHVFTITRTDGRTVKLTQSFGYREMAALGHLINTKASEALLPKATATLAEGGRLSFHHLTVDQAGIAVRGKLTQWSEIGGLQLSKGILRVRKVTGRRVYACKVSRIPNWPLLMQLGKAKSGKRVQ